MHVVLGGTGRIGSSVARSLLAQGAPVTIVTRDPAKAASWQALGAEAAVLDMLDVPALAATLRRGRRAFLLNPPADPSTDIDHEERRTVAAIMAALAGSGLEQVVALSTYGARPEAHCADLGVLHAFEQALAAQPIPAVVLRAAYLMSNWDTALPAARADGVLHSFFPADFRLPMVAPADLGDVAARFLTDPVPTSRLHHVEGPTMYAIAEVAQAFATALGRPVRPVAFDRAQWPDLFRAFGFSEPAARSYARMTEVTLDDLELAEDPIRGPTTLDDHVRALVRGAG